MSEQVYTDSQITIEAFIGLGRLGNNAYVLRPASSAGGVTIIDAPEGIEAVIAALDGTPVERIMVTHSHRDHWNGFEMLRAATDAPVFAGAAETNLEPAFDVQPLADGETFSVGEASVRVIHTPGHTPGSICLLANRALLSGDTLFPGGPGRTRSPEDFTQEVESITSRLYVLPPETLVLPGHGASTTIGQSRAEYEVFASKEHPADLSGDVVWLEA